MPLLKFDIIQGRSEEQVRKLLDTTHQAMVQAFDVPSVTATNALRSIDQASLFWKTRDLAIRDRTMLSY